MSSITAPRPVRRPASTAPGGIGRADLKLRGEPLPLELRREGNVPPLGRAGAITPEGREPVRFGAGDRVVFGEGLSRQWEETEPVRKHDRFG